MCRVQFRGIQLIFDLFLKIFHFIQRIITNSCPTNCTIVPSVEGMVSFDHKCDLRFKSLLGTFCGLALISCFFLQTFHPIEKIITNFSFLVLSGPTRPIRGRIFLIPLQSPVFFHRLFYEKINKQPTFSIASLYQKISLGFIKT